MLTHYRNSSKKQIITINPTQLSDQEKQLLHAFLSKDEQNKGRSIKVFEPQKTYPYQHVLLKFTHHVVRQTTSLPEIAYKEYSYTVYHGSDLKGKGSFGSVYKVTGTLKHHTNKEMVFNAASPNKKKVIKKQCIRKNNIEDYLHTIFLIKRENQLGQLVRRTKTKKLTFQKNQFGDKEAAFFVMKKFNGPLNKIINDKTVCIEKRLYVTMGLIEALFEIHAAKIIHRDVKPDNIFVDPRTMKVNMIDFGLSRIIDDHIPCGTLLWIAPEVLATTPAVNNEKSDGYSMGRVIKKWWGDLSIEEEEKIKSILLLKKKQHLYQSSHINEHAKLNPIIEKELANYLRTYPNDMIKDTHQFAELLDKITYPTPNNRLSLQKSLVLFSQLFYRAFSDQQKKILKAALHLKTQLYYLSFQPIKEQQKLNYLQLLIHTALKKIDDTPDIVSFFLHVLDIETLKNCYRKEDIKKEVNKIIGEAKINLQKRNYLKNKILTQEKNNKNSQDIALYKKRPVFILDEIKKWNAKYQARFIEPLFTIALSKNTPPSHPPVSPTVRFAMYGLASAINISVVLALAGFVPSGGISLLILLVLPLLGIFIGAMIGFITSLRHRADPAPRSYLQQHGLFTETANLPVIESRPQPIEHANSKALHEKNVLTRENVKR